MYCHGCGKDVPQEDFLKNQEQCFRCVYKQKIKGKKIILKFCRECGEEIPEKLPEETSRRTAFCSSECAYQGQMTHNRNYRKKILMHSTRNNWKNLNYRQWNG